jgi:hypothetical protein
VSSCGRIRASCPAIVVTTRHGCCRGALSITSRVQAEALAATFSEEACERFMDQTILVIDMYSTG